jgi:hypothetical protein
MTKIPVVKRIPVDITTTEYKLLCRLRQLYKADVNSVTVIIKPLAINVNGKLEKLESSGSAKG